MNVSSHPHLYQAQNSFKPAQSQPQGQASSQGNPFEQVQFSGKNKDKKKNSKKGASVLASLSLLLSACSGQIATQYGNQQKEHTQQLDIQKKPLKGNLKDGLKNREPEKKSQIIDLEPQRHHRYDISAKQSNALILPYIEAEGLDHYDPSESGFGTESLDFIDVNFKLYDEANNDWLNVAPTEELDNFALRIEHEVLSLLENRPDLVEKYKEDPLTVNLYFPNYGIGGNSQCATTDGTSAIINLNFPNVAYSLNNPGGQYNVIAHEFGHGLECFDDSITNDSTPDFVDGIPVDFSEEDTDRFIQFRAIEFIRIRTGHSIMSDYSANKSDTLSQNREFWADLVMLYHDSPELVEKAMPELYDIVDRYFSTPAN